MYTHAMTVTTLKVSTQTRDRVKALSDAEHRTADQVINAALDQLERSRRRRQMRDESQAALADPADRAESRAVQDDLDDLRAW
jgi:predicted transcriptional regulator